MEILILPVLGIVIYYLIFHKSKSDISKLRIALKDTSIEDLKFISELVNNELKSRTKTPE